MINYDKHTDTLEISKIIIENENLYKLIDINTPDDVAFINKYNRNTKATIITIIVNNITKYTDIPEKAESYELIGFNKHFRCSIHRLYPNWFTIHLATGHGTNTKYWTFSVPYNDKEPI